MSLSKKSKSVGKIQKTKTTIVAEVHTEDQADRYVTIQEIRELAGRFGVEQSLSELMMIRGIQMSEGNEPCFATKACDSFDCLWKKNCQRNAR